MSDERPTLAVFKFASCDGCQLSLLDLEDELLGLAHAVRVAHFAEMTSAHLDGPYDVALVEGSITTPEDAARILEVRASARTLVTIGACASAGGIQGLRNFAPPGSYPAAVYAHPEYLSSLDTSTPIADHVAVDVEVRGCPVDKGQLLEVILAALARRRPVIPTYSVCRECKARANVCVVVARGEPCLGPVTQAGCGGLCPSLSRGCFGCFGPAETAHVGALVERLGARGPRRASLARLLHTFNAAAPAFAQAHATLAEEEP